MESKEKKVPEESSLKDALQRAQAELINMQSRFEKSLAESHKFANISFFADLLPIVENIEHAAKYKDVHGIEMILSQISTLLKENSVEEIAPEQGDKFDHQYHESISIMEKTAKSEEEKDRLDSTVDKIHRKGYMMHGRVIRAAQVTVLKINIKGEE